MKFFWEKNVFILFKKASLTKLEGGKMPVVADCLAPNLCKIGALIFGKNYRTSYFMHCEYFRGINEYSRVGAPCS